jgi:hypothetical protein
MSKLYKLRPKSFSEGHGIINQFPKSEEIINYSEIPESVNPIVKTNILYTKIIGFLFHLVLISVFEVIFFNYYIIQYENNAIISLVNQLATPIINSCNTLSPINKIRVDDFIDVFINETTINSNAISDYNIRQEFNQKLYIKSIYYCLGVILVFFMSLFSNIYFKQKIDFLMVILDNIVMISILGIYEYIFFSNIIFKYMTISPNELIKIIMGNLLQSC